MNPRIVERLVLPVLYRRTWPRVRRALTELETTERRSPREVVDESLERALGVARRAYAQSPFMRRFYRDAGVDPSRMRTAAHLRELPVLTKDVLRRHADEMLCDDALQSDVVRGATGGSTGVPSPYVHDTRWWCHATAAAWRGDTWTGWNLGERHASIWGTPLDENYVQRLQRRLSERARNFLFLPGFDLSPDVLTDKLDALYRFAPRLVTGYASLLVAAATAILEGGREPLRPVAVVSSAEPLPDESRVLVERAFGAPVFDRYGCRELGIVAQECREHTGLHVFGTHVHIEIDVDGRAAQPGETGRVLATLLDNDCFPMVRYEVGDRATAADDEPCVCGLPYSRIARVEGRLLDVIWTEAGGPLTGVFFPHLAKEFEWIGEFQVIQAEAGDIDFRVVLDGDVPGEEQQDRLIGAVRDAVGPSIPVAISFVKRLARTPSGKVRVTQSHTTRERMTRGRSDGRQRSGKVRSGHEGTER